jgi:hypothetical protein
MSKKFFLVLSQGNQQPLPYKEIQTFIFQNPMHVIMNNENANEVAKIERVPKVKNYYLHIMPPLVLYKCYKRGGGKVGE